MKYERIRPETHTGAGYGNTYRFRVTHPDGMVVLSTCERDAAYDYALHGLPVPVELAGPYDGYGHKV